MLFVLGHWKYKNDLSYFDISEASIIKLSTAPVRSVPQKARVSVTVSHLYSRQGWESTKRVTSCNDLHLGKLQHCLQILVRSGSDCQ
jgi:hypothetical protein